VKGYLHPISIARKLMETLPHVFLVGEGAERFAGEMGFQKQNMLSDWAATSWRKALAELIPAEEIERIADRKDLVDLVKKLSNPRRTHGTVNFIAQDAKGNICCGVSTSGWDGKYPGRLGDSPVIGAGNYADNRYGAAACTGMGEMAIRAGTARSVVLYMRRGLSVDEAGQQAMQDLNELGGPYSSEMNIIALDRSGNPQGFSSNRTKTFIYQTDDMREPIETPRTYVRVPERWPD
jgi:L-asparaginase / beta-aspartyl-peptidase